MLYFYEATDRNGALIKGEMEAVKEQEVVEFLNTRSLVPVTIRTREQASRINLRSISFFESITALDRIFLVRNLSTTIKAGLSIIEAIDIIMLDAEKKLMKQILEHAKSNLQNGQPLSDTFMSYTKYFPVFFVGMLKAGEASGKLAETLDEMNLYMTREYELVKKVKSALAYPAVLLAGSFGVVTLLVTFVVPKLARLFTQAKVQLPLVTRIMLALGDIVRFSLILDVVVVVLLAWLFFWFRSTPYGRKIIASILFKVPIVRDLVKKVALVRFARTLGSLLSSGESILEATKLAAEATGNEYYRSASVQIVAQVTRGVDLAQTLEAYPKLFPHFLTSLVVVGERTGTLEHILKTYADYLDEELDNTLKSLTTIIEPVLLLIMGVVIGSIALSVLLPIYQYIERAAL